MSNAIREMVSGKKIRFNDGTYNLDLSYIAGNRIIAMGFPATGLASTYRNPATQVFEFFEANHKDHYRVYNLAEEGYHDSLFSGHVEHYPFPDHHAPPFPLLLKLLNSVHNFLLADPLNVVAIHCIAGLGRTGTIISCILIMEGYQNNAESALTHFASIRTNLQTGVNFPSQVRTVYYFDEWFHYCQENNIPLYVPPTPPQMKLRRVVVSNTLNGKTFRPYLLVMDPLFDVVYNSAWVKSPDSIDCKKSIEFLPNQILCGHFTIKLFAAKEELFRVSMDTYFIHQNIYVLPKDLIDICHTDKKGKYPDDILLSFELEPLAQE